MLADSFTKNMPPDLLLQYLKTGIYSFKYDDEIKNTKREVAKERKFVKATKQQAKATPPSPDTQRQKTKVEPQRDEPAKRRLRGKQPPPTDWSHAPEPVRRPMTRKMGDIN